ncbi:MAG: efflux RND transporter permease subunit [Rickettsiaceae bacterium H1]|nr:efflux RND transporter permease subunit [Rickettsiaceae bacterium H1]
MKAIIDACIKHDKATLLILIIIFIIGITTYIDTPKELSPDVKVPIILVSTNLQGISPQDSDRLLIKPIENTLSSIAGVKEMRSSATDGRGYTVLEFDAGFNSDKALEDVRAKIDDIVSELPKDATRPKVEEVNLSLFPVLNVALVGEIPQRKLISIARELKKKIESLPNVLNAEIAGIRKETVDVIIKPSVMEGYDLKVRKVLEAIDGNNRLVAAGNLQNGYSVKVSGVLENIKDIANVPVKVSEDSVVTIKDVAEVKPTFRDVSGFVRTNGKPGLVIEVAKRSGKNLIETVAQVKTVMEVAKPFLPEHLSIIYSLDQSKKVMEVLHDLQNNILMATVLVITVIVGFMGIRPAIMVALAIPGSFYIGIIILSYLGMTMNIVVLFSLIMSIGMLVDAAIVVNEYADRKMIIGMDKHDAYRSAALRMLWPIVSSTATTLIVFVPLLFWPGMIGQFMKYLPITLISTLTGSLVMSLVFTPVLGGIFGAPSTDNRVKIAQMEAIDKGKVKSLGPLMKKYCSLLKGVLSKPVRFVLIIIGVLIVSVFGYAFFGRGFEFFPKVEPESAIITVRAQGNFSAEQRDNLLNTVEQRILNINDEVKVFYSRSGKFQGGKFSTDDIIGLIQLEFTDWQLRRKATRIIDDIKNRTKDLKGIVIEVQEEKKGPLAREKPIKINISSFTTDNLYSSVEKVLNVMEKIGGFVNVDDTRSSPEIEWEIKIDRNKASLSGVNVGLIGEYIKMITSGAKVGSYRPNNVDEEVDILVRLPKHERNITKLNSLFINGIHGPVPVSNFIEVSPKNKIKKLSREGSLPVLSITADVAPGLLIDRQIKKLQQELLVKKSEFDPKINITFKGESEDQQEAKSFLSKAFALALMGVILILVIQFNSYYDAFVVMTAVFLSTAGVLIGLLVTGNTFLVTMCGVGIISLAGIVVNNNILLIDALNTNLREGCAYKEAIIKSAVSRVKPILLTAGTTILGLLPMVLKINIDFLNGNISYDAPASQWWVHLSTTVAGGLTFATILTLFFTPVLLMLRRR